MRLVKSAAPTMIFRTRFVEFICIICLESVPQVKEPVAAGLGVTGSVVEVAIKEVVYSPLHRHFRPNGNNGDDVGGCVGFRARQKLWRVGRVGGVLQQYSAFISLI